MQLKDYQDKAVSQLVAHAYDALNLEGNRQQILLKAPTGSGKTIMIASFLKKLIEELELREYRKNLAFIWLAPNTLHAQSYISLEKFYADTQEIKCLKVEHLSQNYLNRNELLFLNWQSVDKEKNTFVKENERQFNLSTVVENTAGRNLEVVVIIDEAHLSAFTGEQAQKVLALINAKIELSVTATPAHKPDMIVNVPRQKVVEAQMIKKGVHLNIGVQDMFGSSKEIVEVLLKTAYLHRDKIASAYQDLGLEINPLLLIQLPSESKALSQEDRSIREKVEEILKKEFKIRSTELAVWLSEEKENMDYIEKNNGYQKVLIFKQAIAQGWDCPRAAVLLIFREMKNNTFGVQTVGRILRMPQQKHYQNNLLDYGFVYTNIDNQIIQIVKEDVDYFETKVAFRREEFEYKPLKSSFIANDRLSEGVLNSRFSVIFNQIGERIFKIEQVPERTLQTQVIIGEIEQQIRSNRKVLESMLWDLNTDNSPIRVVSDTLDINIYESNTHIQVEMVDFVPSNPDELQRKFKKFCYMSITKLNRSKSYKKLSQTLIEFGEYYFAFTEPECQKIFLRNRQKTEELIHLALEEFDIWQKAKGNANRRMETENWEVPVQRVYEDSYKEQAHVKFHALKPFYELQNASNPEKSFVKFLETHAHYLEWWYKNGDKGKEHFAIPYINSRGETALFYVDFVVKLQSGKTALFDTKTPDSDHEAPAKHNALLDYCEKENQMGKKLMGSVVLYKENALGHLFLYQVAPIQDTYQTNHWEDLSLHLKSL